MAWAPIAPWPSPNPSGPEWSCGDPAIGGKLYAGGGDDGGPTNFYQDFYAYNQATNTWATLANYPVVRTLNTAVYAEGKVYVMGGSDVFTVFATDTVHCFDPAAGTWSTKAPMPTARSQGAAAYHGGFIYVLGGKNNAGTQQSDVFKYNIATNSWTTVATANPTYNMRATTAGDRIYTSTGGSVPIWNPLTDTWQTTSGLAYPGYGLTIPGGINGIFGNVYLWAGRMPSSFGNLDVDYAVPDGTGALTAWVDAADPQPATASYNVAGTGSALYLLPEKQDPSNLAYITVFAAPGAEALSALDVIGQFRYHPRWPELQTAWGGGDDEWDKVMELYTYDTDTGTFTRKEK